jgi:hypothetical protein
LKENMLSAMGNVNTSRLLDPRFLDLDGRVSQDASQDVSQDASQDAGLDAGLDVGLDVGLNARQDSPLELFPIVSES